MTRAATEVHLTQSAVSRTLQQLEDHLGQPLIDRSTHHVALTDAGQSFKDRAAVVLEEFDALTDPRPAVDRPLRVGHSWSALGRFTTRILDRWRELYPGTPVELQRWDDRYAGLLDGRVDVAILRGADPAAGFVMQALFREQRVAAVASSHPLAARRSVTFADLHDQPLVSNVISGATKPSWWPADTHPADRIRVTNMDDWVVRISAGHGFGIASESMRYLYPYPGVTYLPLLDGPPVQVDLAWPRRNPHPSTAAFVHVAEQVLAADQAARTEHDRAE